MVENVSSDEAFEVLVGDVMRTEPFPNEIKVIGKGIGWANSMRKAATARGLVLTIDVKVTQEQLEREKDSGERD